VIAVARIVLGRFAVAIAVSERVGAVPRAWSNAKAAATPSSARFRVLRGMSKTSHRYDRLRAVSITVSMAILAAVPASGLARVDVWGRHHYLFFHPTSFRPALAGVIVGVAAMYVATFSSNVVAGRLFCGWGCPVGQLSRFGDAMDLPGGTRRQRIGRGLRAAAFATLLVVSSFAWWVDLRVFWLGRGFEAAVAWGSFVATGALAAAHVVGWRWRFCQTACPIGLYYSLVSPATWFGVHFRNHESSCIDCDACDEVCPVGLEPRDLAKPIAARGGLAVANAPGRNHCLECGDCVRACQWILAKRKPVTIPLRLGYFRGEQRIAASEPATGRRAQDG
jgi:polyferredoxin